MCCVKKGRMDLCEFDAIYLKYSPQIYRVCLGYFNNKETADDLLQETFIAVWNNLSAFKNQSAISTWIFRIATNKCLRALEKSKRMPCLEIPDSIAEPLSESTEDQLCYLYECIAELVETDRLIISLYLENLDQAEIAVIIGLTSVNVRVRLHRIREKLTIKFRANGRFE